MNEPSVRPDFRQRFGGGFLRLCNPLVRRMISAGLPTGAPNILLTVQGRRSGKPRTTPVGMIELNGRKFVQASYGEAGWVGNLRAAGGEATISDRDRRVPVRAVELPPEQAAAIIRHALEPYRRSRLLRALFGPRFRPPIGVLWRFRIRIDDTLEEYVAEARRHPLFELRPVTEAPG
jgi:deazaflavin-dependent oxidoreductase (nitroreductase family)